MKHRFQWTSSGTTRDYLTDQVEITPRVDGDSYTYLDDTTGQDVRRVRLLVTLEAVFEQDTASSSGTEKTPSELWLALLRGDAVDLYPDTDADASLSVSVELDLQAQHRLFAARQGTLRGTRRLQLRSEWMQPTDSRLDAFGALTPLLTS